MSIYLCVQCGRFHPTEAAMKKCKHKDAAPASDPVDPVDPVMAKAKNLHSRSAPDKVKGVAEALGIEYTNKRDTLAAIMEAVDEA